MVRLVRGSDVGWVLLRRPRSLWVVHLLIIFWTKWSGRDKRVSNEVISILESITSLTKIDDLSGRIFKEIGVTQVPIPGDEKDLVDRSGFQNSFEEGGKELVDEVFFGLVSYLHIVLLEGRKGEDHHPE